VQLSKQTSPSEGTQKLRGRTFL